MLSDDSSLLLNIGVKCSHFRAKAAHFSGHLPAASMRDLKKAFTYWTEYMRTRKVSPVQEEDHE